MSERIATPTREAPDGSEAVTINFCLGALFPRHWIIRRPRFTLEFPDAATLEAARQGCLEAGCARIPGIGSLEIGDECELAFVTPGDDAEALLCGRVIEVHRDPELIEVAIEEAPAPRPRRPSRTASGDAMAELRNLSVAHAIKLAGTGNQRQRVALERIYGKVVWGPLLSNPKITVPEVARIARKGALPRPLLTAIVDNPSWSTAALVRRAALTNPRLSSEMALTLLRQTPKNELKLVTKQTAYPASVREVARKLLKS